MAGSDKPYYEETWFEVVFVAACFFALFLLFYGLMPPVNINNSVIQNVAMAKLFSEGRVLDAFARFNMPPIYPLLLAIIIKIKHSTELPRLIEGFRILNLGLGMVSVGLVHYFVRRQLSKPYLFIITGLYALAAPTLGMAWSLSPQMIYMVLSMGCLIAIDISLSTESAMGGQLSRGEIILCGVFLALSILSWQVGYLMMIAFFFVMLKRFGLKKSATVIGGIMLAISPFIGRDVFYVIRSPQPYIEPSVSIVRSLNDRGLFRTMEKYADHILINLTHHAVGELNLGSLDSIAHTPRKTTPSHYGITQEAWLRWLIGLVAIVGAVYGMFQYTGIGSIYLCTYVIGALALLPNAGLNVAPVIPLLLFYLYYGLLRTGQWLQRLDMPLLARFTVPVLTVWIALCTITTHLSHAHGEFRFRSAAKGHAPKVMYMSTVQATDSRLEEAQNTSANRRAMEWLKKHTPESARVGVPRPEAASELSAGKSRTKEGKARQAAVESELGQYDYLVEEGSSKISKAQANSGLGLKLVYEDVPGRIRIWRVKHAL